MFPATAAAADTPLSPGESETLEDPEPWYEPLPQPSLSPLQSSSSLLEPLPPPPAQRKISHRAARELGSCILGPEEGDVQRGLTRGETVRIAREMRHEPDPGGNDVQRGCTRGETARQAGGMGHGPLFLMAAREGIGHTIFHQAPPCENPPLPTRPANKLSTPNSVAWGVCGRVFGPLDSCDEKEFNGSASAGVFGDA